MVHILTKGTPLLNFHATALGLLDHLGLLDSLGLSVLKWMDSHLDKWTVYHTLTSTYTLQCMSSGELNTNDDGMLINA